MANISKTLAFSVSNIRNPSSVDVLLEKDIPSTIEVGDPPAPVEGEMIFSIGAVALNPKASHRIRNLSASVEQNYSYVRKSYQPIFKVRIFAFTSDRLIDILSTIDEAQFAASPVGCGLKFNDIAYEDYASLDGVRIDTAPRDRTPSNILRHLSHPVDFKFPFVPRYNPNGSILDRLNLIHQVSFAFDRNEDVDIEVPANHEILLFVPYVSSPTPVSAFSATTSNITASCIVSCNLDEVAA